MNRIIAAVVAAIGFLFFLTVAFGSWYTVDQGEVGVQLRNGAVVGSAGPGMHFKLPVIDSVVHMSVRTEKQEYEKVASYSRDQQTAELRVSVNFRVSPASAGEVYATYGETGVVDRLISPHVYQQTKTVFGQYNAAEAIAQRAKLNLDIEQAIRAAVGDKGIIIESVQLENIDFSEAYEQSIEKRMQAEVEVAKLRQQLEQDRVSADRARVTAQGEADATLAKARAQADAAKMQGDAEASAIAARGKALRDNPDIIALIQAERWNGSLPTTMVPGSALPMINLR